MAMIQPRRSCSRPNTYGMRRSCDRCGRIKKKCSGELPCRLCLGSGNECTYSKRRWHIRPLQPDGDHTKHVVLQSSSCVPPERGTLSLKRCRFSASPATGLVGMQENTFLADFFDCMGFLPFTTQSNIREAMVQIMTPVPRQQTASGDSSEEKDFDADAEEKFISAFGGRQLPRNPSTCTFWCAVALGALVKGNPVKSVGTYSRLAIEALAKSLSGPADLEVATAWNIMAYLYGFKGEMARFHEYLAMSDSFVSTSIKQGSTDMLPVGFVEIIGRASSGRETCPETGLPRVQGPISPQLNRAADGPELYRYVMQSFEVFEQAVAAKLREGATAHEHAGEVESNDGGTRLLEGGYPRRRGILPGEVSNAMGSVIGDNLVDFEPLEETVDRPSIGSGIGGLLINGTLVFHKACKGDLPATVERVHRCVEVFVRYPGLCRSVFGTHVAHRMLAVLVAIGDLRAIGLYNKLRAAYNPSRPPGSVPVPPWEEWEGIAVICDDMPCRATDELLLHECMSVFSRQIGSFTRTEESDDDHRNTASTDPGGQNQIGSVPSDNVVPEGTMASAKLCSGSGEVFEMLGTFDASRQFSRVDHSQSEGLLKSTPGSTASNTAVIFPLHSTCGGSGEGLNGEGVVNCVDSDGCSVVRLSSQKSSTVSVGSPGWNEEGSEDVDAVGVAASDWLDALHAFS